MNRAVIEDLRRIMIMTGEMSDLHLHNLQQWGKIVFDNYDKIELAYNLNPTDPKKYKELTGNDLTDVEKEAVPSYIAYTVVPKKGKRITQKKVEQALKSLQLWIRDIFWSNIHIKIFIKDKEYNGLT
jgi:hypothetical protein